MVSSTTRLAPTELDGELEAEEQPLEVVLAGLLDLAALDHDMSIDDLALLDQPVEVEAERGDVLGEVLRALLEGS